MTLNEGGLPEPKILPIHVPCPDCQSPAGAHCTRPTDVSRSPVGWKHRSRIDAAARKQGELNAERFDEQVSAMPSASPLDSDRLNRHTAETPQEVINRLHEMGVEPYDYAYNVVLDDRYVVNGEDSDPVYEDHIHATLRKRDVAINKAIEQYRFAKGKFDVYVTVINLDTGRCIGNVLSLSAVGPDGHGFFDNF